MNTDGLNNWQQFNGTELGSVLAGIYGNKPKIVYPAINKSKKAFVPEKHAFKPCNAKVNQGAVDPRRNTRRPVEGHMKQIPTGFTGRTGPKKSYSAIDFVAKRRDASIIKEEINIENERRRAYRPANSRQIGESEKDRYVQVCEYKGGKALMKGCVNPTSVAPYELAAQKNMADKEAAFRATRGLKPRLGNRKSPESKPKSENQQMAEQIMKEIDERCNDMEEMRDEGTLDKAMEQKLKDEIRQRTIELSTITD